MRRRSLFILSMIGVFLGCSRQPSAPPVHTVFLLDVSASIVKSAEQEAFQAVTEAISRSQRGDTVSVIPITGDADAEAQGQILRFRVPAVRQAYDQDLKRFAQTAKQSLESAQAKAVSSRG